MLPLMLIVHIFLGSTLAGTAVIAVLVMGYTAVLPIVLAAAVGFVAAFPASYLLALALLALVEYLVGRFGGIGRLSRPPARAKTAAAPPS